MSEYVFKSGAALLELIQKEENKNCEAARLTIAEIMQRREEELFERTRKGIRAEMSVMLMTMREDIEDGLNNEHSSLTGLTGGDAYRLSEYAEKSNMGERMAKVVASAIAVVEVNSSMGQIVAAPTAGACGILPGVLLGLAGHNAWDEQKLVDGLFTAGCIGMLIAQNASISGAECGCQAETGTAAAMAAAAVTELCGGKPEMALHAAAIALKNVMGLVCDPVCGLVESPCIKRNAIGAANAVLSADLALAGVTSLIPFDEVVSAMRSVGRSINVDLRETARGGLAATPTAKFLAKQMG